LSGAGYNREGAREDEESEEEGISGKINTERTEGRRRYTEKRERSFFGEEKRGEGGLVQRCLWGFVELLGGGLAVD